MKNYLQIIFNLILLIVLSSCSITKNENNEKVYALYMSSYKNYNQDIFHNYRDKLNRLNLIDSTTFSSYLENGVNSFEIKKNNIIFLSKFTFYKNSNLKGNIPLCIVGYYYTNNIKHYVVVELYTSRNSTVYILNEKNGAIKSSFLVNSTFETNRDKQKVQTKRISDSIYEVNLTYKAYQNEFTYYQIKISNNGFVIPLKHPVIDTLY